MLKVAKALFGPEHGVSIVGGVCAAANDLAAVIEGVGEAEFAEGGLRQGTEIRHHTVLPEEAMPTTGDLTLSCHLAALVYGKG